MSSPSHGVSRRPASGPRSVPWQRGFRAGIDVRIRIRADAGCDLLAVPTQTDVPTAARALRLCVTRRDLSRSPESVLAEARVMPGPQLAPATATIGR